MNDMFFESYLEIMLNIPIDKRVEALFLLIEKCS